MFSFVVSASTIKSLVKVASNLFVTFPMTGITCSGGVQVLRVCTKNGSSSGSKMTIHVSEYLAGFGNHCVVRDGCVVHTSVHVTRSRSPLTCAASLTRLIRRFAFAMFLLRTCAARLFKSYSMPKILMSVPTSLSKSLEFAFFSGTSCLWQSGASGGSQQTQLVR